MCGFAGVLDPNGRIDLESAIARTHAILARRGPDGRGRLVDRERRLVLEHHRLAIFDPGDGGRQPMDSASGRYSIAFNGSIFDHPEQRTTLERLGTRFTSTSDTEVLLAGFEAWGVEETLRRVDGIFAIAVLDRQERRLLLARDRAGQKPLLLALAGGALAFASDLQALETLPDPFATRLQEIDETSFRWFLRIGVVPWPRSIRSGVEHLAPGGLATVDLKTLHVTRTAWWTPPPPPRDLTTPNPAPGQSPSTLEVVRRSVHRQCRSDRPIGVMLSAGLDSRLVAGLASEIVDAVPCFTLAMPGAFDESAEASDVARMIGGTHHVIRPTDAEVLAEVRRVQNITSEPFADSSLVPTTLLARAAREHVVVALGGDGGDELFGGYRRHAATWTRHSARARLQGALAGILGHLPDAIGGRTTLGRHTLRDLIRRRACIGPKDVDLLGLRSLQGDAESLLESLTERGPIPIDNRDRRAANDLHLPWDGVVAPPTDVRSLMRADFRQYLPDDPLVKVDVGAMSVALEYRAPMLGAEVIDHAMRLPTSTLFDDRGGRGPIRRGLEELGLGSEGPKRGFAAPLASWLRGPLREYAGDLLAWDAPDPISRDRLRTFWDEFLRGRRDRATAIWTIVSWRGWLQTRLAANPDRRSTAGS